MIEKLPLAKKRNEGRTLTLVLISILVISSVLAAQFSPKVAAESSKPILSRSQSVPLTLSIVLRRGFYQYYEIDSYTSNTSISYATQSNVPISTAIMTSDQLNDFQNDPTDPISNSVEYTNGTSVQENVTVASGQYFFVLYAYYSRAEIQFGFESSPNTPFSYGALSTPLASGISTFGISNNSGIVSAYEIQTNEIVGIANISSMQVYTADAGQYQVSPTGATLQFNSLLVVNDNNSSSPKVYWVQNVPDFETGPSQVSFGDEIWNWTDQSGFLSNQTITSSNFQNGGFVSPTGQGNSGPYVYDYSGPNDTYNLPMNFALLERDTVIPHSGVLVQMGYILISNGTTVASKIDWFDNVTVVDPNVQTAYFDVSGKSITPIGLFYDSELVFAGEGNLEVAHFTEFNASLGLFYQNSTNANGLLSSFPSYYSFSGDTGEAVDDLAVSYSNGIASLGTSVNPNYAYLGTSTMTLNLQSLISSTTSSQGTTSTTFSTTSTISSSTLSSSTESTTGSVPATSSSVSVSTSSSESSSTITTNSTTSLSQTTTSTLGSPGTSTTSSSTTQAPAWDLLGVGIVIGVIFASIVFLAVRRKPPATTQPI